jgi:hypothetical protein
MNAAAVGPSSLVGYMFVVNKDDDCEPSVFRADDDGSTLWLPIFRTLEKLNEYVKENDLKNFTHRRITDEVAFMHLTKKWGVRVCLDLKHENGEITCLAVSMVKITEATVH